MNLIEYHDSLSADGKKLLADKLGTSYKFLNQVIRGHKKCSVGILLRGEDATNGMVTEKELLEFRRSYQSEGK